MKDALMDRLKPFLLREDNISLVGNPATHVEIAHAEQQHALQCIDAACVMPNISFRRL
ncbi:hypothetical protein [Paenibacillus lautus]|uniref:hypothetical protein n=1 Tax=Paenibacillus lautus TaxID=1401 RepID=UPI003D2CDCE2